MQKKLIFLVFCPIFLFSGVFEHLLDKNMNYLFENHFTCLKGICQSKEKNIFDNNMMDDSIQIIKTFLDQDDKVFKIEIELTIRNEQKNGFYQALLDTAVVDKNIEYSLVETNDKYGNHTVINIIQKNRQKKYIKYYRDMYLKTIKNYKEDNLK